MSDELREPLVNPQTTNNDEIIKPFEDVREPFELVVTAANNPDDRDRLEELAKRDPSYVTGAFLRHAAILMYEGRHYIKFGSHPKTIQQLRFYDLYYNSPLDVMRRFELFVTILLLALTIFEEPETVFFASHTTQRWIMALIEVWCVMVIAGFLYWRTRITGWRQWWSRRGNRFRLAILSLMIIDVIAGLSSETYRHYRLLRLLRPLFLVDTFNFGGTRRVLQQTFYTTLRMTDMVVLLLTYVVLFAVIAHGFLEPHGDLDHNLRDKLKEHDVANGIEYNTYFNTFDNSFKSLFVAITTANYPDVSMPAMLAGNYTAVGFVIYMFFGCFFVVNFFLAVVYESFQRFEKRKETHVLLHKRRALRRAFVLSVQAMRYAGVDEAWVSDNPEAEQLVDYNSAQLLLQPDLRVLDFGTFAALLRHYNGSSAKQALLTFAYLTRNQSVGQVAGDRDGRDTLMSLNEFLKLYEAVKHDWKFKITPTLKAAGIDLESGWGSTPLSKQIRRYTAFANSTAFELLVHVAILVNLVLVLVDAADDSGDRGLHHGNDVKEREDTNSWELVFFGFYLFEALVKLLYLGKKRYFNDTWNRFDFGVVTVSVVGFGIEVIAVNVDGDNTSAGNIRVAAVIFRCIRLLRVLRISESFRHVAVTMMFVVRKMARYITVLLLTMYGFAIIGMAWFQHTVSRQCPLDGKSEAWQQCGSAYDPAGSSFYQLQSFDNILYSYNTLFSLLIVNNWQFIMEGHVAVAPGGRTARLFFIIYFILVALVVLNVITAFLLDGFVKMHPYLRDRESSRGAGKPGVLGVLAKLWPWQRTKKSRKHADAGLPDHFVDLRDHADDTVMVSLPENDLKGAKANVNPNDSREAKQAEHERMLQAQERLYHAYVLSLARAAFEVTEANMRAIATQYTQEQRVVLCNVPAAWGLAVSSARSPITAFRHRVLPSLQEKYDKYEANEHGPNQSATTTNTERWEGDGNFVARVSVPYSLAQSVYPGGDEDLRNVQYLFTMGAGGELRLQYQATRPVTRDDINHALWGQHIESSRVTDDNSALDAVLNNAAYLHDCTDLATEDQYEDFLFLDD
eukprot:TRINITY_DN11004_c0_g1_i3.p1 TRINITY_DN11004_c0_g1~~TRINITY_DN11004_c0_g1_i3.p1  ORF type:complete len:1074 (+),score=285.59 TRINITY_DN11004_c0_g1_i3:93-3314(+)